MQDVKEATASKAEKKSLDVLSSKVADQAAVIETLKQQLAQRIDVISSQLATSNSEARSGVIAATRAANEARQAVNGALQTLAAAEAPASAPVVARLQDEVALQRQEASSIRSALQSKADVIEVAEAIDDRPTKATVAAALHKKLSVSKLPDALSPVTTRIAEAERQLAGLSSLVAALQGQMQAAAAAAASSRQSAADAAVLSGALSGLDRRLATAEAGVSGVQQRVIEIAADVSSSRSACAGDCSRLRAELADVRSDMGAATATLSSLAAAVQQQQAVSAARLTQEDVAQVIDSKLAQLHASIQQYVDDKLGRHAADVAGQAPSDLSRVISSDANASILHRGADSAGILSPSASSASSSGGGITAHRLRAELASTRADLRTVAREVQGIIDLLDIGGLRVTVAGGRDEGGNGDNSDDGDGGGDGRVEDAAAGSSDVRVSAATAARALRTAVSHITQRVSTLEHNVAELRTGLSAADQRVLECQDSLLQHASALQAIDSEADVVSSRLDVLECGSLSLGQGAGITVRQLNHRHQLQAQASPAPPPHVNDLNQGGNVRSSFVGPVHSSVTLLSPSSQGKSSPSRANAAAGVVVGGPGPGVGTATFHHQQRAQGAATVLSPPPSASKHEFYRGGERVAPRLASPSWKTTGLVLGAGSR